LLAAVVAGMLSGGALEGGVVGGLETLMGRERIPGGWRRGGAEEGRGQ